jgi:ankyrin repeat protein
MNSTNNVNELLKKYYETYMEGKQIYKNDKEKSFDYFKESLEILKILREKYSNKIKKHEKLLEESETECHKYISLTIESTIESEYKKNKTININDLAIELERGDLNLIKMAKYGEINFIEKINNETILHLAIKNGDTTFLKYAFRLGARIDTTNEIGNTLLEYACLQKDPNVINFLGDHGANMQKHLYFRSGDSKYINNNNPIDICILLKIVLSYIPMKMDDKIINNKIYNKIKLLQNLININDKINLNNYTYADLLIGLMHLLNKLSEESAITYLNIINEELNHIGNKLGCPKNKLELLLINLVPFIDYPFNLSVDWVIIFELKYLIINLIKKKKKYNSFDIKNNLMNLLWETYLKNQIIQEDYLGCLISQWIAKIKV